MDHIYTKLGQAGYDVGALNVQPTTTTVHKQKITHITGQLGKAGINTADASLGTAAPIASTTHHSDTKWIAVGVAVGVVVLIAIAVGTFFFIRSRRNRKAYIRAPNPKQQDMHDKDVFNADIDESQAFHEASDQLAESRAQSDQLTERNYESGYGDIDTSYEGSGYDPEPHGDKRAKFDT